MIDTLRIEEMRKNRKKHLEINWKNQKRKQQLRYLMYSSVIGYIVLIGVLVL